MLIQIPFSHLIEIDIDKLIAHCDETQLNELILLASKKLDRIERENTEVTMGLTAKQAIEATKQLIE